MPDYGRIPSINTHEALQAVSPAAKVVYGDNDPMVSILAAGLLADGSRTAVIQADLREPTAVQPIATGVNVDVAIEPPGHLVEFQECLGRPPVRPAAARRATEPSKK
jgi:hypothetical protein